VEERECAVDALSETMQSIAAEADRKKESRAAAVCADLAGSACGGGRRGAGVAGGGAAGSAFLSDRGIAARSRRGISWFRLAGRVIGT